MRSLAFLFFVACAGGSPGVPPESAVAGTGDDPILPIATYPSVLANCADFGTIVGTDAEVYASGVILLVEDGVGEVAITGPCLVQPR